MEEVTARTNRKPTNWVVVAAIIVIVNLVVIKAGQVFQSLFRDDSIEGQMERFANDSNENLPVRRNSDDKRWDRIETGPGRRLTYVFSVPHTLTEEEKESLKESAASSDLKLGLGAKLGLGDDVNIWYRYLNLSGNVQLEFRLDK
jgi:hypothetical protein